MRLLLWCRFVDEWVYLGDWHVDDKVCTVVMAACRTAGLETQLAIYRG